MSEWHRNLPPLPNKVSVRALATRNDQPSVGRSLMACAVADVFAAHFAVAFREHAPALAPSAVRTGACGSERPRVAATCPALAVIPRRSRPNTNAPEVAP